ncbi:nucleoside 2-deoxyribosyltransferase domain-containing protein [Lysobacter yananisis]|uniref:Nucleoside 2-deoxyribosyltransferase domain-containing protein n=1 Tax=Lysobacter yananisis TaxID=1003114 RepID=A0ABY9PE16_9GAMM|nr:nucleoside 2-deoxyribosyltransferase domain-containing protein [Lysobacter yananisis]WMT05313.1 nucleoside 2-deoxyribosyltransferase domain-containing protein [Lysobacter yananisis]
MTYPSVCMMVALAAAAALAVGCAGAKTKPEIAGMTQADPTGRIDSDQAASRPPQPASAAQARDGTALARPANSQLVRSPQPVPADDRLKVFLAGSIDMGGTTDWQAQLARELADEGVVLLNPRREDWNPAWKPVAEEPEFRRQVEWELTALQRADVIAMYLAPGSQAPVSLLELGLHAGSDKVLLACPDGFWRKGNVDIVAQRYGIPSYDSLPALAQAVRARLAELRQARAR